MIGMNYRQYTLPEDKALIENYHREIYRTGNPGKGLQHRVVRKDGSVFYVELVSTLMKNSDGKPIGYRGISRDITEWKRAEKILKESEQHFKEIIEGTPVPTIVFDKNQNIVHWNRACEELTGIQSDDVIGKNRQVSEKFSNLTVLTKGLTGEVTSEEIFKLSGSEYKKSGIVKNAYEVESFFPNLGKKGKWLFITVSPLENSYGQSIGVIETILDITAMKQAEADLKKSEKKYHDFFQNVLDFIFIHDLEGNFIENNALYVKEMGARPDIIAKSNLRDLIPEKFRPDFDDYLNRIQANGRDDGVIAIQVPDGELRILEYKNLLVCDDDNRPTSVLGSARDITEHIKDKKALRESKQQLKEIIEGSPIPTIVFNKNYHITQWNRACEELTGIKAVDVAGQSKQVAEKFFNQPILPDFLFENISLKDISIFYGSECRKSKIVENAFEVESFFPQLGEKGKWLFLTLAFLRDPENNIIGVIETLLDVTSQKRAEKKLMRMHDALEEKVEERTTELQEVNIALEVLLKKRENDKKKFEDKVAYSIKEILTPHIELLKKTHLDKHQKVYLEILEENFREIASPFMSMLSDNMRKLTRTEIQIVNLIKQNKITKEIADLMGVSTRTVETHRDNIRKKFGIKNKKVNLRSFLLNSE
jgi:PAS domain S-box-containing protein